MVGHEPLEEEPLALQRWRSCLESRRGGGSGSKSLNAAFFASHWRQRLQTRRTPKVMP